MIMITATACFPNAITEKQLFADHNVLKPDLERIKQVACNLITKWAATSKHATSAGFRRGPAENDSFHTCLSRPVIASCRIFIAMRGANICTLWRLERLESYSQASWIE